jgi:hypothetical protein
VLGQPLAQSANLGVKVVDGLAQAVGLPELRPIRG